MARLYNIFGENITVANAAPVTLIGIMPGTTAAIQIVRMWIAQHANATSAQIRIAWGRQVTAFATVTSATPQKVWDGDPASVIAGAATIAAGKCGVNASAEGAGAKTNLGVDSFNALNGWLWVPTPDEVITLAPSSANAFFLAFAAAPATLTGWNFGLTFREIS